VSALFDFETRYAAALADHLVRGDEETLSAAYELGRSAVERGIGLLDVMAVHHRVRAGAPDDVRAAHFLSELLTPFEMAYLGFREANEQLRARSAELEQHNAELEQAKEKAEAAVRELEAFSYSVSHDLRAPLRSVDGFSQALLEDAAEHLDETARGYLTRVRAASQRMGELIDSLLELSRINRAELNRAPVNLALLAESTVVELRSLEPARQIEIAIEPAIDAPGDRRLLQILLANLIGNAWKFTGKTDAPRIDVGCERRDDENVYYVRDNGAGFDMSYARRLFTPFQRLHADTDFPGTGIGLATARRIIERHGGRIWAEGEIGRGATVFFTLP
jgi:light-regulated signal transduction histidine kinase (bacteriophytochrome)